MGKQAKVTRDRFCLSCEASFYTTAKGLKAHANLCARAKAINLQLIPAVNERPAKDVQLVKG